MSKCLWLLKCWTCVLGLLLTVCCMHKESLRLASVGPFFLQNAIHLEEDAVKDSWFAGLRADLHWMHEIGSTALPANWNEGRYNAPH